MFGFSAYGSRISYQGKLTDMAGVGINDALPMAFVIYNAEIGGDSLWGEVYNGSNAILVNRGFFDVLLGSINPINLPFDTQYWLEIIIDGTELIPRLVMSSSPYSFSAAVAESVVTGFYVKTLNMVAPDPVMGNIQLIEGANIEIVEIPESNEIRISANVETSNPLIIGDIGVPGELIIKKGDGEGRIIAHGEPDEPGVVVKSGEAGKSGIEAEAAGGGAAIKARNEDSSGAAGEFIGNLVVKNSAGDTVFSVEAEENKVSMPRRFTGSGADESTIDVEATGTEGIGLTGTATVETGSGSGLVGVTEACGDGAAGVKGEAMCTTGETFGVVGVTRSETEFASGVSGIAVSNSGRVFGVSGASFSNEDFSAGVRAYSGGSTGQTYGLTAYNGSKNPMSAAIYAESDSGVGVHAISRTRGNHNAAVKGLAAAEEGMVYGVLGSTSSETDFSSGIRGVALSSGKTFGVYGDVFSDSDLAAGVRGHAHSETGTVFGVLGSIETTDPDAAAVMGRSDADHSIGVRGVAGGVNGYGVVSDGMFAVRKTDGTQTVLEVDPVWQTVKLYSGDGTLLSEFGGPTQNVPIQVINGTATPTIPDNDFTIEGELPIRVTTESHGIKISIDSLTLPDTIQAKLFIAGDNEAHGRIRVRDNEGTYRVDIRGECTDEPLVDAVSFYACPSAPAMIRGIIDDVFGAVEDTFTQAAVKGLTNIPGVRGVVGANSNAEGLGYGVVGTVSTNNFSSAGVYGYSSNDVSAGVRGRSGGPGGHGVLSLGKFEVMNQTETEPLFLADPSYDNVVIFKPDGSVITEFGGIDNRAPIQTINTIAKPTIPDNNLNILGETPIRVLTETNSITIGLDSVFNSDTIKANFFIAGSDTTPGKMVFRNYGSQDRVIIRSDCSDLRSLIDVYSYVPCPWTPALIRASFDWDSVGGVADTFLQASIKGLTNIPNVYGIMGASSNATGNNYGVIGTVSTDNFLSAGVYGYSSSDISAGVRGRSGGPGGHGVLSLGKFEVMNQTETEPLFLADPSYDNVVIFKPDGSVITEFGGVDNRAPIQTINTTAKPTLPDNNFTIEGLLPIRVTTNANGIIISADSLSAGGDTVKAKYFIAGQDSANGGMLFKRWNETYYQDVIRIRSDCDTFPMIHATNSLCNDVPSVITAQFGGSLSMLDTFPRAAIKGINNLASNSGSGVTAVSKGGNGLTALCHATSGNSAVYAHNVAEAPYPFVGFGVKGITNANGSNSAGIYGEATSTTNTVYGVYAKTASKAKLAAGVYATAPDTASAIYGYNTSSLGAAGTFNGNLRVVRGVPWQDVMTFEPLKNSLSIYRYNAPEHSIILDADDGCYISKPDTIAHDTTYALRITRANRGTGLAIDNCKYGMTINTPSYTALKTYGNLYFHDFTTVSFFGESGTGGSINFGNSHVSITGGNLSINGSVSAAGGIETSDLNVTGVVTSDLIVNEDLIVREDITAESNLTVYGSFQVFGGVKNFVEPHPLDPAKMIRFTSTEANQVLIEHRSSVALSGGYAEFEIPEEFILVAEPGTFSVNVTAQTLDDPGRLGAIVDDGKVKIRAHGASADYDVAFTLTAVRKGYADYESVIDVE